MVAAVVAAAACGGSGRSGSTGTGSSGSAGAGRGGSGGAGGSAGAGGSVSAGGGGTSGAAAGGNAGGIGGIALGGSAVGGSAIGGIVGGGGEGGEGCELAGREPVVCADAIETAFLGGFSVTTEDNATSALSETSGIVGAKALRLVTQSGFLVTLRGVLAQELSGTANDQLRLLVRAKNTNTGWQGNVPLITLEDAQGKRRAYQPTSVLYPTDGVTWVELRVPLSGGGGFQTSGDVVDFSHIKAFELTADTWEAGFTIDVDGVGIVAGGARCAVSCPGDCSGRGDCSPERLGCVCEVGAQGGDCGGCRSGFALKNGHCALSNDGQYDYWPNAVSKTNGDAWLQTHHQAIKTLKPNVLALNFVNPSVPANVETLVGDIIAGFREGSRPLGAENAAAAPGLDYQLLDVIDLRDGVDGRPAPPNDYAYENSTLFPRRPQGAAGAWSFDYAALFSDAFAKYYGFADPNAPGQYLDLCELIESGRLHELWIVGSGDVPDVNAAEVLESKQRYDASRNPIAGSFEKCAGNGCFDDDVPHCARSVRIGFVNYNRGPGCYLHSQGHGLESAAQHGVVPPLRDWFLPFAGFDLDQRYGLPGSSFYAMLGDQNHAEYPAPNELDVVTGGITTHVSDYVASCGNVHFPPNASNHYDYASTVPVTSDCADFGRNVGACRPRKTENVTAAMWANYEQLSPDCGGAFLVWWYQHMPGFQSQQSFDDGREMLSVWPFLFY